VSRVPQGETEALLTDEGRTRVMLVDRHPVVHHGVRATLPSEEFAIVAEALTGSTALRAVDTAQPDVVLVDPDLPDFNDAEICRALHERSPESAIVVFSSNRSNEVVRQATEAGAQGYVLKDAERLDLPGVLRRIASGDSVFDGGVAGALVQGGDTARPLLSGRELAVLRLASEGLTNSQIGAQLYLSRHTVKEYLSHAMKKLEAKNRTEAVREATRRGLLGPSSDDDATRELRPLGTREPVEVSLASPQRSFDPDVVVPPVKITIEPRRGRSIHLGVSDPVIRRLAVAGFVFAVVFAVVLFLLS
jgi:DNA-binding NarL/FixJ family response regulator